MFDYDALDRLVSTAQYLGSRPENRYGEDVSWDRNGNVTRMERRGGAWRSGVEQILIDYYGGAISMGGVSGNARNAIGKNNPNRQKYIDVALKEFKSKEHIYEVADALVEAYAGLIRF